MQYRGECTMLRIAICDDEQEINNQISNMIKKYLLDSEIVCYLSGKDLLSVSQKFDIIFLDIQMEGLNGIETAKNIRKCDDNVIIIFITGIKEYVFEAFDVAAFHYLLKPIQEEKLHEVLERAEREINKRANQNKGHIVVKNKQRSFTLDIDDIIFFENALRKVVIHTETETISVYGTMSEFEKKVGDGFYRSHRGYLANMAYISEYDYENIYMNNGEKIYLTRKKYQDFVKHYMRFLRNGDVYNV